MLGAREAEGRPRRWLHANPGPTAPGGGVSSLTNKWRKRWGTERAQPNEWAGRRTSDKKLPFLRPSWLWGMGPAHCEWKRPTYTVQTENCFLWGIRLTAIPDMSPWQRWGRKGGREEQMGVTEALILMHGPPPLSPWPLGSASSCVSSHCSTDVNPIQFNRPFWVPTMRGSFASNWH